MSISNSEIYIINKIQKSRKFKSVFGAVRWLSGQSENLLWAIDEILQTNGHLSLNDTSKEYSDSGELLLYTTKFSLNKEQVDVPVEIYYNPNTTYNSFISGVSISEEHKKDLKRLLIDSLVNLRFLISKYLSDKAIHEHRPLKVAAGDIVWGIKNDTTEFHAAIPIKIEVK